MRPLLHTLSAIELSPFVVYVTTVYIDFLWICTQNKDEFTAYNDF